MTRALIRAALVIALVTAAVFLLIRLVPGDPVVMVLGEHATDEAVNQLREQLDELLVEHIETPYFFS